VNIRLGSIAVRGLRLQSAVAVRVARAIVVAGQDVGPLRAQARPVVGRARLELRVLGREARGDDAVPRLWLIRFFPAILRIDTHASTWLPQPLEELALAADTVEEVDVSPVRAVVVPPAVD
jgi:hypothetical protein